MEAGNFLLSNHLFEEKGIFISGIFKKPSHTDWGKIGLPFNKNVSDSNFSDLYNKPK